MDAAIGQFLAAKVWALDARARRLARLDPGSVGIRTQDRPFAPSEAHFRSANRRLAEVDGAIRQQLERVHGILASPDASPQDILVRAALVERQIDRARRAYGLFFDVFSQRGTRFALALAACDAVAADCFSAMRSTVPDLMGGPLLKPLTYLKHSFSPATFRRGVMLRRLLGERNPFPLVRIPYERIESPWGMGVLLHEVGHNLHADLGIWQETQSAVQQRVLRSTRNPWLARIWARWHKEIFADLLAILLGGPASTRSMKDFLAYPPSRVLSFNPLSAHPTPYLRAFLMTEFVRRIGFPTEARRTNGIWRRLYDGHLHAARIPRLLLDTAPVLIPAVIDELGFQPRRNLAHHALVDILPFTLADERRIREGARMLLGGKIPVDLPPRHLVSASRYAFDANTTPAEELSQLVLGHLSRRSPPVSGTPKPVAAFAA